MCSNDLVSHAQSRGWYHPGQGPFDFTKAHALPISVTIPSHVLWGTGPA
jgi:hypothetical protein